MNDTRNYKLLVLEVYPEGVCKRLTYRRSVFDDTLVRRTFHVKDRPGGRDISGEHSTGRAAWEAAHKNTNALKEAI